MGTGDVRRTGENRTWTAQPAEQTDQSPHRDRRESRPDGKSASNGKFVNTLLDEYTVQFDGDLYIRSVTASDLERESWQSGTTASVPGESGTLEDAWGSIPSRDMDFGLPGNSGTDEN